MCIRDSQTPPVTVYDVILTATDESGTMTTLSVFVPNPYSNDNTDNNEDPQIVKETEEGLPAVSLLATLSITLLGAAFAGRGRRD